MCPTELPPDYKPKYAAGSSVDNIRTGRQIYFSNGKGNGHYTLYFLGIVLACLIIYIFFLPPRGPLSATIYSATHSADAGTVFIQGCITNETGKPIFNAGVTAQISTKDDSIIGIATQDLKKLMLPGEEIAVTIAISVPPLTSDYTSRLVPTGSSRPFETTIN